MSLHIESTGHGPPLVLLHGWAMHSGVFSALSERLRKAHTLYLVDLPGHGNSRESDVPLALKPVTQALLNTLPPAIWLGWSLGGLFALHAAGLPPSPIDGRAVAGKDARHPKISALVMLCASPCFVRQPDWPHGMPPETFQSFASGLEADYRQTLERFIALEAFGSEHARDELRCLRELLLARGEPARQALTDGLALLNTSDLRDVLPHLNIPSLWLSGRRDRLVHPRAMHAAAELAPNAQSTVLAHCGHAPMLTHADQLATQILQFTATIPAQ